MASVKITDNVNLTGDLELRDDCLLAKVKLTQLAAMAGKFLTDFEKPINIAQDRSSSLGATFDSPELLNDGVGSFSAGGGINCGIRIVNSSDKLLFADDGFSLVIPIAANQAWLGVEVDLAAKMSVAASADGLGVSVNAEGKVSCSSYTLFTSAAQPLPSLRDAAATAFSNYSLSTSPAAIHKQPVDTVNITEVSGSITAALTFEQPFALNALASANLPFNVSANIQPSVTLQIGSSLKVTGDFLVRCYKVSDRVMRIGVYKKQGSTLSVSLTAGAAIEGNIADCDVLSALLNKALPGVDVTAAGITDETMAALSGVIRDGMDRSLSAQFNAVCSAALTHEAALLYDIQLDAGDNAVTDSALGQALHGNWAALEALPNAKRLRNIAVETAEKKRSLTVNLLGFYSATSTTDYLKTCSVLVDDSGQVTITDKIDVSRISASTSPYAADRDKLRQALMEDFLCTATYAVVAGKLNLNLVVSQSYRDYERSMSREDVRENILLGYTLGLIPQGSLDSTLAATAAFTHALVSAVVTYDMSGLLNIFYKDPATKAPRSRAELEQAGREMMCALLDPSDAVNAVRIRVLRDNGAWTQMDDIGNRAAFHDIPELSQLSAPELGAVGADWTSIVWWADAIAKIAPALTTAMDALDSAPAGNPNQDANFTNARVRLSSVLGSVMRKTNAAFVPGWGAAVMFALSGMHGMARMDLNWNSKNWHYEPRG